MIFRCLLATLLLVVPALADSADPTPVRKTYLVNDLTLEIDRRIAVAGSQPGAKLDVFSTADDFKFIYQRNPACWVRDLDLTGLVVSHDYLSQNNHLTSGGALITPQDVICPAHFAIATGGIVNFVDAQNVIHTGKVLTGSPVRGTDIYLCHLAAPVTGVKAYKVLPPNYATYTPFSSFSEWPFLLIFNFGHRALVLDAYRADSELHFHPCTESARAPYTLPIRSGSGSPAFAIIDSEPVLLGCLHSTSSTSWIAGNEDAINTTLAALGSTYKLTTYDLSSPVSYAKF